MGPGSVLATQLAAENFGGKVLGKPIEVISADMQSKPTSRCRSRGGGKTLRMST